MPTMISDQVIGEDGGETIDRGAIVETTIEEMITEKIRTQMKTKMIDSSSN